MSEMAGADDPWGIPEGQTFAEAFNNNLSRLQSDGTMKPETTGNDQDKEKTDTNTMSAYETFLKQQAEEQTRLQRMNATETMKGLLESYGLNSLYNKVVEYVKDGYDADAIMTLIRTTPEYKQRFPAMEALTKKGRAMSESSYIEYERTAAELEQRYGLPKGMLMDNVTGLLTNEVSAAELNDRVLLASAAAIQAPKELRTTFRDYYGIDEGGLAAYFLDPQVATPLLQKQAASAVLGTEAYRQGLDVGRSTAEQLQELGVTQDQAREGFGRVAGAKGLTAGAGDVVTQDELIGANLKGDAAAAQAVSRAAGSRVARFEGGGGFAETKGGNTGLGSAATR